MDVHLVKDSEDVFITLGEVLPPVKLKPRLRF